MNYIMNSQPTGEVADVLAQNNFDPGALRPWRGDDGRSYVTVVSRNRDNTVRLHTSKTVLNMAKAKGLTMNHEQVQKMVGKPILVNVLTNAPTSMRKDDWLAIDRAVVEQARPRLQAFNDLRAIGTYSIPNGMAKTILEYEHIGDTTPATTSMDGLREGDSDRPEFDMAGLPLPITHKDFNFPMRQLMASRSGGSPLDTTNAGLAGLEVAEEVERTTLGLNTGIKYGGYQVYGYKNFPNRISYDITTPLEVGWTPKTLVNDVLAMKAASVAKNHRGPWKLYNSPSWDSYLDSDYSDAKGDLTLRDRIGRIKNVSAPETLDFLTGYNMLLVQQTPNVARAVVGMEITTVQWPSHGGFQQNFKVLCILVPQLRADKANQTGIVDAFPS